MKSPAIALAATLCLATPAMAADPADGAMITQTITGNTVQGSMVSSGVYTEFYDADGTIRGADYQGKWSVKAGQMCFEYGQDPATCWNMRVEGDQVTWVLDGKDLGTGTVVGGNPNGF